MLNGSIGFNSDTPFDYQALSLPWECLIIIDDNSTSLIVLRFTRFHNDKHNFFLMVVTIPKNSYERIVMILILSRHYLFLDNATPVCNLSRLIVTWLTILIDTVIATYKMIFSRLSSYTGQYQLFRNVLRHDYIRVITIS